tara:strand:+ start:2898 stop:3203 length:306 start_codon:yes stop_codon:yes gene_type:complete
MPARMRSNQEIKYAPISTSQPAPFEAPPAARPPSASERVSNACVYSASPALLAATASRHAPVCGTTGSQGMLRVLHAGQTVARQGPSPLGITLNSLDFRKR